MKRIDTPKSAMILLAAGLLLTSLTPILNRYIPLPDVVRGFITGLGMCIEVIAIIKIDRVRKSSCTAKN
jgi:hypothetical protein